MFSDVKSAPLGGIFRNLESEIRNPILIFRKSDTIRSGLMGENGPTILQPLRDHKTEMFFVPRAKPEVRNTSRFMVECTNVTFYSDGFIKTRFGPAGRCEKDSFSTRA